jgi:hypothetical protein
MLGLRGRYKVLRDIYIYIYIYIRCQGIYIRIKR